MSSFQQGPRSTGAPADPAEAAEVADAIAALIRDLSTAQTLDEITPVVSHAVRTLLHADGATVVLRDGDWCQYAEEDAISPLWKGRRFPLGACMPGWCMLKRQAVAIPDVYRDTRGPADMYRPTFVRSLVIAPVGGQQPLAALEAYWSQQRQPGDEELHRLQAIADAAAPALTAVRPRADGGDAERKTPTGAPAAKTSSPMRPMRSLMARARHEGVRPNSAAAYAFAVVSIGVATLVREAVEATGVKGLDDYATYFPAVLLTILVAGKRAGVLAAALSAFAADFFFMAPTFVVVTPSVSDVLNYALFGGACALMILIIDWYQSALLRLRLEDAKHFTLAREQRHRVKNALAVVEAVIKQSLHSEPERARIINQRIRSGLADVEFEDDAAQEPIGLRELITAELQAYDLGRISLDGPAEGTLAGDSRRIVTLALHELATNALKYGALTVPDGRVAVTWRCLGRTCTISWRESGGPPVEPPKTRGYGSVLLRRLVEAAGGALTMEFPRSGLIAEISLPLGRGR